MDIDNSRPPHIYSHHETRTELVQRTPIDRNCLNRNVFSHNRLNRTVNRRSAQTITVSDELYLCTCPLQSPTYSASSWCSVQYVTINIFHFQRRTMLALISEFSQFLSLSDSTPSLLVMPTIKQSYSINKHFIQVAIYSTCSNLSCDPSSLPHQGSSPQLRYHYLLIQLYNSYRESLRQSTYSTAQAPTRVSGCVLYFSANIAFAVTINASVDDMLSFKKFLHKIGQ